MTYRTQGPTPQLAAALLGGLETAHGLDGPQLAQAVGVWCHRETAFTGTTWTGRDALRHADDIAAETGARITHSGVQMWRGSLRVPREQMDDAAALWALCHLMPEVEVSRLLEVIAGNAHVWLDRHGWHLRAGPPDPAVIAAAADDRDEEARACCQECGKPRGALRGLCVSCRRRYGWDKGRVRRACGWRPAGAVDNGEGECILCGRWARLDGGGTCGCEA